MGSDFNGDGRDDILWRNLNSNELSNWLGNANGTFTIAANGYFVLTPLWQAHATGDFNGDGRDDMLWRHDNGALSVSFSTAFAIYSHDDPFAENIADWAVVGTGDFNGDGRDDLLWSNVASGALSNWLATSSGGFVNNYANAISQVPTSWRIAGIGDFNGDGRDDILWRNDNGLLSDWLGTASGGFAKNDANALIGVPTDWQVAGTGDFNGDGRDDILWRNDNGAVTDWLGTSSGGFTNNDANAIAQVDTSWQVAATGDYNGDGRDDILWRNSDGRLSDWLGTPSGGFVIGTAAFVANEWLVMPNPSGAGFWDY